jgi:hypothetical protein
MSAGRDNVISGVRSAILLGHQVLGSALKPCNDSLADFVDGGEFCGVPQPHRKSAVKATAFLTIECGATVFSN